MFTFAHKFKNPNKRRNTTKDLTGMVVTACTLLGTMIFRNLHSKVWPDRVTDQLSCFGLQGIQLSQTEPTLQMFTIPQ